MRSRIEQRNKTTKKAKAGKVKNAPKKPKAETEAKPKKAKKEVKDKWLEKCVRQVEIPTNDFAQWFW